jgi:phosphoserine aminotransferase
VVLVREDFLARAGSTPPTMLRYKTYAKNNSLYNTPPVFAVYMVNLVLGWIEENGGLEAIGEWNRRKAKLIYDAIDESGGFYRGHAAADSRSLMNLTFRLADEGLEKPFVEEAKAQEMVGLAGHRSVGGIRASLYNATDVESCRALAQFMAEFASANG